MKRVTSHGKTFDQGITAIKPRCLISEMREKHEHSSLSHTHYFLRQLAYTLQPRLNMTTQTTSIIDTLANGAFPGIPSFANLSTKCPFTSLSPPPSWGLCLVALIVPFGVNPCSFFRKRTNEGHLGSHFFFGLTFWTPTPARKKILIAVTNPVNRMLDQSSERIASRLNRSCCFRMA